MAYVLVHEEDWTSYGTDINAVSNNSGPNYGAYVSAWDGIGSNLSGHGTTVGPTSGPNGGPGVQDLATSGGFIEHQVDMTCREFKIEVLYDFTGWSPSAGNENQLITQGWHAYPVGSASENSDFLFILQHNSAGTMILSANDTGNPLTNYSSGSLSVPTSGNVQVRLEGRLATISGTAGSFSAASDGYVRVYINDVLWADTGAISLWHHDASIPSQNATNYSPYWNVVELGLHGRVGLWQVWADDACLNDNEIIDNLELCCDEGSSEVIDQGGETGNGAVPVQTPTIGIPIGCVGGGTVPTQADITYSETWWGA